MVAHGVGALDARKSISERFLALHGRTISDYVEERRRPAAPGRDASPRILPPELGWDKYEPACRRLAAFNALLFVGQCDGTLDNREIHERKKLRHRWMHDQRQRGGLPKPREGRGSATPLDQLILPYQKQMARRERQRSVGEEGAYWRRVDDVAGQIKQEIDDTRRYARALDDHAISAAGEHRRPVDHVKRDIAERFTQRYLDSPPEYLETRLEQDRKATRERELSDPKSTREGQAQPRRSSSRKEHDGRDR